MTKDATGKSDKNKGEGTRAVRSDARRNTDALLKAAMAVFSTSGVEAPVREIAEKAGVGIGTLYRHFPERSDLVVAVFQNEIDACAGAAAELSGEYEPREALERWMQRYVDLVAAKRGLAAALHSGNPAFDSLPDYFKKQLRPALQGLLDAAATAGEIRADVQSDDLLWAVPGLCMSDHDDPIGYARRMVALLVDGLRYKAGA